MELRARLGACLIAGRMVVLAVAATFPSSGVADAPENGGWSVSQNVSPLTDQVTVSATRDANDPVLNTLGRPDRATLVLRCGEGVLAAYVAWPDVLDSAQIMPGGASQTKVSYRVDESQVMTDFWDVGNSGTSAGAFQTLGATRLLGLIANKSRLVVRMTSRIDQDAVFNIAGIDAVIARLSGVCKTNVTSATWRGAPHPGAAVQSPIRGSKGVLLGAVQVQLEGQGLHVIKRDDVAGTITTELSPVKLTTAQVDCGKRWGMSYLIDGRVKSSISYLITVSDDNIEVRTAIEGVQTLGFGMENLLVCTSTGTLEKDMIARLQASPSRLGTTR